jgi:ubiquinone/menaquinone biosynthesis C-methylase UbiE
MDELVEYYEQVSEQARLAVSYGPLELARTQELIARHLPSLPAVVLDVGGAAGVYSFWLASLGYQVHLIDSVPKHIEQARQASMAESAHPLASLQVGDARHLPHADSSVDAVLLLGPLYHLTDPQDRLAALLEARRVLRPRGRLFAAAICRFASLLDSLSRGFLDDPRFVPILERDVSDGQHRNPTDNPDYFTHAFFHLPDELRAEVTQAGFSIIELVGVEGPAWLASDFERRWADPERRQRLLDLVRQVEHEPSLLGISQHLLVVAAR